MVIHQCAANEGNTHSMVLYRDSSLQDKVDFFGVTDRHSTLVASCKFWWIKLLSALLK